VPPASAKSCTNYCIFLSTTGNPSAVWTVKGSTKEMFDRYIVVSFVNATLVLSIGETVEEATDSGLLTNSPTMHVANIGDDGFIQVRDRCISTQCAPIRYSCIGNIVSCRETSVSILLLLFSYRYLQDVIRYQVHPNGIRHVRADKRTHEWKPPGKKTIVHATSNERQVAVALSGGDIYYFELDGMGQLMDVHNKFMGREVACLALAPIPHGRQHTRFLAVGDWVSAYPAFSTN